MFLLPDLVMGAYPHIYSLAHDSILMLPPTIYDMLLLSRHDFEARTASGP